MSLWDLFKRNAQPLAPEHIARRWGRLNFHSVVRHVTKAPVFVHCHECRWPVNPGRTHMFMGTAQALPSTEEQMRRVCEGVRQHMGLA